MAKYANGFATRNMLWPHVRIIRTARIACRWFNWLVESPVLFLYCFAGAASSTRKISCFYVSYFTSGRLIMSTIVG